MDTPRSRLIAPATLGIAVIALIVAIFAAFQSPTLSGGAAGPDASLERIRETGVLRVGYGSFPPYTQVDETATDQNLRVTGFSADLIREIASRSEPALRIEWVPFSWDTLQAEVASERFDVIIDPVFQTVPRAQEFRLVRPYSYFGIGAAIVRRGDRRFSQFSDLNRAGITIALAEGWTTSEFARATLTRPTFHSIPVTGDALAQLEEVRLGRADVALNDVPTVLQYAAAHSSDVEALWVRNPPSYVPGSFLVRREDDDLADFLDASIEIMITDGTLRRIDERWRSYGFIPQVSSTPGAGLPN